MIRVRRCQIRDTSRRAVSSFCQLLSIIRFVIGLLRSQRDIVCLRFMLLPITPPMAA